jgi:GT2 family glycosyltransferase/lipopolysaccharide/colanic/teichoic acid biosynthesis glycosyltransferase
VEAAVRFVVQELPEELKTLVEVSIVIVSYNSRGVLGPCLESLKRQSLFATTEVVVVDNASSDGTPAMVRERYPWVRLIAGRKNLGFSRGVNIGIREARGRYFLILNPDTVVRRDSIERLVEFAKSTPEAGIIGPKLVYEDGTLQYSCRRFYTWKVLVLRRTVLGKIFKNSRHLAEHLMLDFDHETTREVDWLLGACLLVRREAVESVGLLDERFFLYFEDVDWCFRMKHKGWKVFYHPASVVIHTYARGSAQSVINRSVIAHLASLVRYYDKWNPVFYFLKRYREVMKIALFVAVDVIAFNLAFLLAYYLRVALGDFLTNPIFPLDAYERFVVFENLLFVFTYFGTGLYRIRRETAPVDELFSIVRAILLASIILMASTYLGQIRTYSRMVVAFLVPFAILCDWLARTAVRKGHRLLLAQKIDLKRVCIVGPVEEARELEARLFSEGSLGIDVVGVATPEEPAGSARTGTLGTVAQLEDIVDRYRIQELIFLPNVVPDDRVAEFVMMGRRRVLDVTVVTDYSGLVIRQAAVANLAGRPVIAYRRDTRYALDRAAKRLLDVVLGAIFLLVSIPVSMIYFVVTSLRGGVPFQGEERLGLGGRPFVLPVAGKGSSDGPSDIVNLPLFWLVVAGKLSMVGPYPLPTERADALARAAEFRFDVRPGVTGYWRIGRERETTMEDLLAQDANYVKNWSLLQDIKILMMSFANMLFGRKRRPVLRDES